MGGGGGKGEGQKHWGELAAKQLRTCSIGDVVNKPKEKGSDTFPRVCWLRRSRTEPARKLRLEEEFLFYETETCQFTVHMAFR